MKRTSTWLGGMALFAILVSPVLAPPVDAATSPTVVTIQFDDGNANQYAALTLLNTYGMHATFYVNSGVIGDATHLSWAQLSDLAAAGNEIASHTLLHTNIKKLKTAPARQAVCGDRVNLWNHGFQAVSFAYPFGSFDGASEAVVQACGFNSGRGVSGVNDRKVFAETIPPLDAYATRTPPNPKQGTTVATIESYVTAAQSHGGGWVQLVLHNVCDQCDAYSITQSDFTSLLTWLQSQGSAGVSVETTAQVVGGVVQPIVQP
jgi:peptidoglycan/xylan/chitin deacetylase (PgdA/CDA1 family)